MKKVTFLLAVILMALASTVNAEAIVDQPVTEGVSAYQVSAVNVEKIIDNKESVQDFITTRAITGIDTESQQDNRICPFCWLFAAVFAGYLYKYAKKLKTYKKKIPKDWYKQPLFVAIGIYFAHAFIHDFFASSIFLHYYWMILFDELVVGYFYYFYHLVNTKKVRKLNRKTA
jgi:hypothetical protein